MRVIAGSARRLLLVTPDGLDTRPTQDKIKETLFNILQMQVPGSIFLDICAGSGGIGIEALSRGAAGAVFVDQSPISVDHINRNLKNTGLTDAAKVIRGDYAAVLLGMEQRFDFAFLDPPYASGLLPKALLAVQRVMKEHGLIICEHPKEQSLPEEVGEFALKKIYRYGKVCVSTYHRKGVDDE